MKRLLLLALVSVITAACSKTPGSGSTPTSPSPTANGPISYTAIGASDGIGFGGSAPCIPLSPCPDGTGYVQILARRLAEGGRQVSHLNLSLPGSVMSRAIEDLAASIGRPIEKVVGNFSERQAPFVAVNSTQVTIFAGGNDANVIGQAVRSGAGGADPNGYVDGQVRQWGTDLVALVNTVRSRAPNARIVALNLPNLAGAPYVAAFSTTDKQVLQRIAVGLTDRVNALTANNVLVVDLMCDARMMLASNYSSDGFHPNDSGYAIIAEKVLPALRDGTATTPASSCAQRTLF